MQGIIKEFDNVLCSTTLLAFSYFFPWLFLIAILFGLWMTSLLDDFTL